MCPVLAGREYRRAGRATLTFVKRSSQTRSSQRSPEPTVVTDAPDLLVIQPVREWTCAQCQGTGDLLIMAEPGPLFLARAELDHLLFLPAGAAT